MRAPPLARIPAVAAPRPDAEPVTITHKPSLDIGFLLLFEPQNPAAALPYRWTDAKLHCAELRHASRAMRAHVHACQGGGFCPSCAARSGSKMPIQNRGTLCR